MKNKNDGGPAFPAEIIVKDVSGRTCFFDGVPAEEKVSGMSLRDYFAAKVMQGICADGLIDNYDAIAKDSYSIADAMLKARNDEN